MTGERVPSIIASAAAAVVVLLTISVVAQASAVNHDFLAGESMRLIVRGLATPLIGMFGLATVAAAALAGMIQSLEAFGVKVFGNSRSAFVPTYPNTAGRVAVLSLGLSVLVLSVATLAIGRQNVMLEAEAPFPDAADG